MADLRAAKADLRALTKTQREAMKPVAKAVKDAERHQIRLQKVIEKLT